MAPVLPDELWLLIFAYLTKTPDLLNASLVCKSFNELTTRRLWRVVRQALHYRRDDPKAMPSVPLPKSKLRHTKDLQFLIGFPGAATCRHNLTDESQEQLDLRLSETVNAILDAFEDGQIEEFSWHVEDCIPQCAIGSQGILSTRHPGLQLLAMSSDTFCQGPDPADLAKGLDAFRQLRTISWMLPSAANVRHLALLFKNNAEHLRDVELITSPGDIVYGMSTGLRAEDDELSSEEGLREFMIGQVLCAGVPAPLEAPVFPAIRKLCLDEVGVDERLGLALNFETLEVLVLHGCPGWGLAVESAARHGGKIRLREFELYTMYSVAVTDFERLCGFITAFSGLRSFCASMDGSLRSAPMWECLAGHHAATLKRFVHCQQRIPETDEWPNLMESLASTATSSNEARTDSDMGSLQLGPQGSLLKECDLEFLGFEATQSHMHALRDVLPSKTSLRALHLRGPSLEHTDSGDFVPPDGLLQFARWIFGSGGVQSLQYLRFGDVAFRNREGTRQVCYCRCTNTTDGFRMLDQDEDAWERMSEEFGGSFAACTMPYWG